MVMRCFPPISTWISFLLSKHGKTIQTKAMGLLQYPSAKEQVAYASYWKALTHGAMDTYSQNESKAPDFLDDFQ